MTYAEFKDFELMVTEIGFYILIILLFIFFCWFIYNCISDFLNGLFESEKKSKQKKQKGEDESEIDFKTEIKPAKNVFEDETEPTKSVFEE